MAGNDEAEEVGAVGPAHGALRTGPADFRRDLRIGAGDPGRDAPQRRPHLLLERRTDRREEQFELQPFAGEITPQLRLDRVQRGIRARHHGAVEPAAQVRNLILQPAAVHELQQVQPFLVGKG